MQSNPKQSMGFPPPQRSEPLPCPRCDSTATKFCYYNNYNLSQPRYLCKSCRRYWTHGGTLRNVPVGGATRKISKKPRTSSSSSSSSSSCSAPSTAARPAMLAPTDHHTNTPVLSSLGLTEFPYMSLDDAASGGVGVFADFSGSGSALLGSSSDSDYNNAWDDELAWPTLAISTPHHPPENLD